MSFKSYWDRFLDSDLDKYMVREPGYLQLFFSRPFLGGFSYRRSYHSSGIEPELEVFDIRFNRWNHAWQNRRLQYGGHNSILNKEQVRVQI